jgi:LacI family transcriptional regulator/LacI family repressor for deo operon, udp, cdd, tsx, nupC, and nupG
LADEPSTSPVVTSIDVARVAGVSQSTVSLVLSGKSAGRVSPVTRALVEETAERLGYRLNVVAQALRTGTANLLALAVPNVTHPFFGAVLMAAELAAREHGYAMTLIDTSSDPLWPQRMLELLDSRLLAGCIVYAGDDKPVSLLASRTDRAVFVEAENPTPASLDIDIEQAVHAVVGHLTGLGHQRIGYLAAAYPKATYRRRFASFREELAAAGLAFEPHWRADATFDVETATRVGRELLERADVTAVFCEDDLLAGGLYRACRQLGRRVPDELSVIGFDDIEFARMLDPELTTVAIPAAELGRSAVELLLHRLRPGQAEQERPAMTQLALKLRGSTAAAP